MRISRLRRPRFFAASIFRFQPVYTLLGFALIGTALILSFRESETRAGAADLSSVVTVNAASYDGAVAPGAIAAAFGTALAARSDQAGGIPLPTELAGTSVRLIDSRGFEHSASLFFVSAGQINYLIPEDAALGSAKITITSSQGVIAEGEVQILNAAPAVFTFASNGRGVPVGLTTYDGSYFESIVNADGSPRSISPGTPWQPNYVTLFGTGLRNSADLRVRIAGIEVTPFYAGPQGHFVGLDQVNFVLPPNLPSGSTDLLLTTGGRGSNHVELMVGTATSPTQTGLSLADVQTVIGQAVARATALNLRATIAIVDHEGNVLGVFRMTGANPFSRIGATNLQTGVNPKPMDDDGLEGISVPSQLAAISKAGTAAFFSTQGNAFSTRSAGFIIQEHLPPLISFQPAGPLFGVQFSQLPCSDIKIPNLPLGLAGDPGGVPLYKNGVAAGGIGIELDGLYSVDIDASDFDQSAEEIIAVAGTLGFESPLPIRGDQIYVDGIRLPFINAPQTGTTATFNPATGTVLSTFIGTPASKFEPFTLGGVPGRIDRRFFPFRGSTATGRPALTAAEVTQMLGQAAQQAYRMRAAIRRPLGSPVEVNITVVDVDGQVLGLFSTIDAPIFGFDVSVQKARTAAFFSKATAGQELRAATGFGKYADAAAADGLSLAGQTAFSARGFGFLNRPFFPDGIDGTPNGPFSEPIVSWSPFNVGIQSSLVKRRLLEIVTAIVNNQMIPAGPCTPIRGLENGIQIFAGGVPVYKNGVLVGAVGISGDGIDQDDTIASTGSVGFEAPEGIRTDQVFVRGVRLPYVKFPRHPNL